MQPKTAIIALIIIFILLMIGIIILLNFPTSNKDKTDLSQETERINKDKTGAELMKELSPEEVAKLLEE